MGWLTSSLVAVSIALAQLASAQTIDPELVGTWTTNSRSVFTGPGFYNPVAEQLTEPSHTGISYSFTSNGWYEEAYYRAVSNPTDPKCPSGVMQWQHGTYARSTNGTLTLTPIGNDGRMLQSQPCQNPQSGLYTHYSQPELFQWYEIVMDPYHGVKRLNLYQFDGSPMNPMYLYYYPTPQMLPTSTLHPTGAPATASPSSTSTAGKKVKRGLSEVFEPALRSSLLDPDRWWWFGIITTGLGAVCYFMF